MKLKSFKYFFGFLILIIFSQLMSEEKIDIWKNNNIEIDSATKDEVSTKVLPCTLITKDKEF